MFVTPAHAQTETSGPGNLELPPEGEGLTTTSEHVETAHGSEVFPPFDSQYYPSQLLWLAITFGILYFVLQRTILPRIAGILENRRDRIALDLDAAERMRVDADEAQAAYEQELASARDRSHKIALEARDVARQDADAERKRNEAELDAKLEAAQARIGEIKAKALADVDAIAEETTQVILDELTSLSVSREEVTEAVRQVRS